MSELAVAVGLVLVIEGLVWAVCPRWGRSMLAMAVATPPQAMRAAGAVAIAIGVGIVWLARG